MLKKARRYAIVPVEGVFKPAAKSVLESNVNGTRPARR